MSIIATVLGKVVLELKKRLKDRLSANVTYILWLVFLIPLIFPIMLPSRISIYNFVDVSDVKNVGNEKTNKKLWEEMDIDTVDYISKNNCILWKNIIRRAIAFGWFIVFVSNLIIKLFSYIILGKYAREDKVTDERIILILEKCKKRLKIKRNIKVIQQDVNKVPCTIGIFDVKILVTRNLLELDDIIITDVFMHELSHYKRKDNIVNFVIIILRALHWFNPFVETAFKNIRNDMEFATDEMAVSKMSLEEQKGYCDVMLAVAELTCLEEDTTVLLGLSNGAKTMAERIKVILKGENYQKNSKFVLLFMILISLLISLVFYPTSYGMNKSPKLYLKLESGDKIEVLKTEGNLDISDINEVKVTEDSKLDLLVKDGKTNDYIFYNKVNLNTMKAEEEISYISSGKISYFESGEYIYKFILVYGNDQSSEYAIKIIVE